MNRFVAAIASAWLVLSCAGWARAQDDAPAPPAASLTVLSRPAGASFRVVSGRGMVGRAPMTIEDPGAGALVIEGWERGYERWRKRVTLRGVGSDTVWIALHPKSAARGALRSMLLPAWGQFYEERPGHGWTIVTLAVLAVGDVAWAQIDYGHKRNDLDAANSLLASTSPGSPASRVAQAQVDEAADQLDRAHWMRTVALGSAGGVYALGVLDALVFGPVRVRAALVPPTGADGATGTRIGSGGGATWALSTGVRW